MISRLGSIQPEYGFISTQPLINANVIEVVFSYNHHDPKDCIRNLISFIKNDQQGVVNIHLITRDDTFLAYGDLVDVETGNNAELQDVERDDN